VCYTSVLTYLLTYNKPWNERLPLSDDTAGLIFVVDSADRDRLKEAQMELENVVTSDEMRGVPVQVLANKQDLPSTSRLIVLPK